MRTAEELMETLNPAWPGLEWELLSNPQFTVLPIATAAGRDGRLNSLQVSV
jgi:hypothetical protein